MSSQFDQSRAMHHLKRCYIAAIGLFLAGATWWWLTWPDRTLASYKAAIQRGDKKEAAALCKAGLFGGDLAEDPATARFFVPYMSTRPFNLGERIIGTARIKLRDPTNPTITESMLLVERGCILFHPDRYSLDRGFSFSLGQSYSNAIGVPDPRTREAALQALGEMGNRAQAYLPRVRQALQDDDSDVRKMAEWAQAEIVKE